MDLLILLQEVVVLEEQVLMHLNLPLLLVVLDNRLVVFPDQFLLLLYLHQQ